MRRSIPLTLCALSLSASTLYVPAEAIAAAARTATYRGATYAAGPSGQPWGDIAVTIQVKGKKITSITSKLTNDSFQHSIQLDGYALPVLRQEALKSNSYKIHTVSGATQSSEAFIESLKSALTKAHI
jgi:uncharacterized protein with FMN-binding domain